MANPLLGLISYDSDRDSDEEVAAVPTSQPVVNRSVKNSSVKKEKKKKKRKRLSVRFNDSDLVKTKIFVKGEPYTVEYNEEEHEICTAFRTSGIHKIKDEAKFWSNQQEKLREKEEERLRMAVERQEEQEREAVQQRRKEAEEEKRKWFEAREKAQKQREAEERREALKKAAEKEKLSDFMASLGALTDDDDGTEGEKAQENLKEKTVDTGGWQEVLDTHSGGTYYWNSVTGGVSWDKPPELNGTDASEESNKRPADDADDANPEKRRKLNEDDIHTAVSAMFVKADQLLLSFSTSPAWAVQYKELSAEKLKAQTRMMDFDREEMQLDFLKGRVEFLQQCVTVHEGLGLPPNWNRVWDSGSATYYYANARTGATGWNFPTS